jgi:hypothetical protein
MKRFSADLPANQLAPSPGATHPMSPALKSALWVVWAVIVLELISTLVPGIGFFVTLPISIITYAVQGILTGIFTRQNPNFPDATPGAYVRLGALSAIWTAVVFSTIVTFLVELILTPMTAGFSMVGLPPVLIGSLVDLALNIAITSLFAWIYGRYGIGWAITLSCAMGILGSLILSCFALGLISLIIAILQQN